MSYDFRSLSAFDFERLVRDLLQRELGTRFESFKKGPDGGIDLRALVGPKSTIVQCKHYVDSGYRALLRHLTTSELPKVNRLKPPRYIVATSVGLSPANKDALAKLFAPFCNGPNDIFGADDLNNLLTSYPDVERSHFKLWLTSTAVLQALLHSDLINESAVERQRIARRLRLYVQHTSYFHAMELLEKHHYCVIAGQPGIGKSTLAEILTVTLLGRGYEVVVVSNDIRASFKLWNPARKQLFVYDDFLGTTALEAKLHKNEEDALIRLMDAVSECPDARLLLTTREYILNQAKQVHEKLARANMDIARCTITVKSYTPVQRAAILHNHVWFSALPLAYKAALLVDRSYRDILKHDNYIPRIVEWMTKPSVASSVGPAEYVARFIYNLDHPRELWVHAYEHHLSQRAQHLLLVAWTMSEVSAWDLERGFDAYRSSACAEYHIPRSANDFRLAIKELEQAFVSVDRAKLAGGDEGVVIRFLHPSVTDFLEHQAASSRREAVRLVDTAVAFEQVQRMWALAMDDPERRGLDSDANLWRAAERLFDAPGTALWRSASRGGELSTYYKFGTPPEERLHFLAANAARAAGRDVPELAACIRKYVAALRAGKSPRPYRARLLIQLLTRERLEIGMPLVELAQVIKEACGNDVDEAEDAELHACLAKRFPDLYTLEDAKELRLNAQVYVDVNVEDADDADDLEELETAFQRLSDALGIDLYDAIEQVNTRKEALEEAEGGGDDEHGQGKLFKPDAIDRANDEADDEQVVDGMFDVFADDEEDPRETGDDDGE